VLRYFNAYRRRNQQFHVPIEILNDSAFGPSGYNFPGNKRASTIIVSVVLVIPEFNQVTVTSLILMMIGIISVSYIFKRKNKHKN